MQLKKLLALLLSAALALSLLAGCGGESVARSLLALLDGKYANVSVEMDPDLEADLRQAIRTAESENAGDDAPSGRHWKPCWAPRSRSANWGKASRGTPPLT